MINKELKRLSRRELVDIIYQLKKNEQQMQKKIDELEEALNDKRIRISKAGSIAEAATDITGIFLTAQTTADMYLHEIACMKEDAKKDCEKMYEESKRAIDEVLADSKKQYDDLKADYQEDYKKWKRLQEEIERLEAIKKEI